MAAIFVKGGAWIAGVAATAVVTVAGVGTLVVREKQLPPSRLAHLGPRPSQPPKPPAAVARTETAPIVPRAVPAAPEPSRGLAAPVSPSATRGVEPPADRAPAQAQDAEFDVLRVEPTGETVVAGRAPAGSQVALLDASMEIDRAKVDGAGEFVFLPPPLGPGDHLLRLRVSEGGSSRMSSQSATVILPTKGKGRFLVALTTPGRPDLVLTDTNAGAEARPAQPDAPTPMQPPDAVGPPPSSTPVAIRTISVEPDGSFRAVGTAAAGSHLKLYLNGSPVAAVVADADGHWSLLIEHGMVPGAYAMRAEDVTTGKVLSHADVPFEYRASAALAGATKPSAAAMPSPVGTGRTSTSQNTSPAKPAAAPPAPRAPAPAPAGTLARAEPVQPESSGRPASSDQRPTIPSTTPAQPARVANPPMSTPVQSPDIATSGVTSTAAPGAAKTAAVAPPIKQPDVPNPRFAVRLTPPDAARPARSAVPKADRAAPKTPIETAAAPASETPPAAVADSRARAESAPPSPREASLPAAPPSNSAEPAAPVEHPITAPNVSPSPPAAITPRAATSRTAPATEAPAQHEMPAAHRRLDITASPSTAPSPPPPAPSTEARTEPPAPLPAPPSSREASLANAAPINPAEPVVPLEHPVAAPIVSPPPPAITQPAATSRTAPAAEPPAHPVTPAAHGRLDITASPSTGLSSSPLSAPSAKAPSAATPAVGAPTTSVVAGGATPIVEPPPVREAAPTSRTPAKPEPGPAKAEGTGAAPLAVQPMPPVAAANANTNRDSPPVSAPFELGPTQPTLPRPAPIETAKPSLPKPPKVESSVPETAQQAPSPAARETALAAAPLPKGAGDAAIATLSLQKQSVLQPSLSPTASASNAAPHANALPSPVASVAAPAEPAPQPALPIAAAPIAPVAAPSLNQPTPADAVVPELQTTEVKVGDSLWSLSQKLYGGDGTQFVRLYEANADQIFDPWLIYPGQVLVVPNPAAR